LQDVLSSRLEVLRRTDQLAASWHDVISHLELSSTDDQQHQGASRSHEGVSEADTRISALTPPSHHTAGDSDPHGVSVQRIVLSLASLSHLILDVKTRLVKAKVTDDENGEGDGEVGTELDGEVTASGMGGSDEVMSMLRHLCQFVSHGGEGGALSPVSVLTLLLGQLSSGLEHWGAYQQSANKLGFLIERWLSGAVPPPRCAAIELIGDGVKDGGGGGGGDEVGHQQCILEAPGHGRPFCTTLHDCHHPSGCGQPRSRVRFSRLCEMHRCQANECVHARHVEYPGSHFCKAHSCGVCVVFGA
jgi:hypothetical protein